jgi:hypothetical protein
MQCESAEEEGGQRAATRQAATSPGSGPSTSAAARPSSIPIVTPRPLHVCSGAGGLPHATLGQAGWCVDILAQACVTVAANHTEQEVYHMEIGKLVITCQLLDGAQAAAPSQLLVFAELRLA